MVKGMGGGPVEQVGETARTAVTALSGTPAILAMVILQALTLAGIAWSIHERAQNAFEERKLLTEERQLIISKCLIGPKVEKPLGDVPDPPKPLGDISDPLKQETRGQK